jgi:serine/threonine protein phosphatase 1
MRTFAIGDIHGEVGKLQRLLSELRPRARSGDSLVLLGDYIDRGPDSRGVIDLILRQEKDWPGPVIPLMGNHEAVLLLVLSGGASLGWDSWLYTMDATPMVASYSMVISRSEFTAVFPPAHREFLKHLKLWYEDRNGIYVHAGIPRGKHPRQCTADELLWKTRWDYSWEKPVVFGHYACAGRKPLDTPGAVGIDTRCGMGGPLTAVILPEREFVQVE